MARAYNVIIEQDEDGVFVSDVVELSGCHTQAKSIDELMRRTKEAIRAYLLESSEPSSQDRFIGVRQIEV